MCATEGLAVVSMGLFRVSHARGAMLLIFGARAYSASIAVARTLAMLATWYAIKLGWAGPPRAEKMRDSVFPNL